MATRRIADAHSRPIQPVKVSKASGGVKKTGSGSYPVEDRCGFFPEKEPLPVALSLHFETPIKGGPAAAREQLNQDTLLIRTQDPNFVHCWFSLPLDFDAAADAPAFWMLQKTSPDTWQLCLRRTSGEVAAYHLKTRKHAFPLALKKGRVSREFTNWPRTITVSWA